MCQLSHITTNNQCWHCHIKVWSDSSLNRPLLAAICSNKLTSSSLGVYVPNRCLICRGLMVYWRRDKKKPIIKKIVWQCSYSLVRVNLEFHYYVQVQVTRYSTWWTLYSKLEFYASKQNCQVTRLLCSSSSYKIFNMNNIIFQIRILCRRQKNDDKLFFWLELFDV